MSLLYNESPYPDNTQGKLNVKKFKNNELENTFKKGTIVYYKDKPSLYIIVNKYQRQPWELSYYNDEPNVFIVNLDEPSKDSYAYYEDLKIVSQEVIEKRKRDIKEAMSVCMIEKYLQPNALCELKYEQEVQRGFLFFSYSDFIPKGTIGVIDRNTAIELFNPPIDTVNSPEKQAKIHEIKNEKCGEYYLKELFMPVIHVYFPETNSIDIIPYTHLQAKTIDEKILDKIILPKDYFRRIFSITNRVLNNNTHNEIYTQLGLSDFCQKGRGSIFLLYGPPGTGKTFTVEAVAEKLNKPLIKVSLGNLFQPQQLKDELKRSFERAKKYNAILLLDEVDVFIRKRGDNPMFDENTATFLKTLEYYDGILFMTTNLVNMIDPAIFSRVHACLEYSKQEASDRKNIWKSMLNNTLLKYVVGTKEQQEEMFNQLADININGREIKNAIQNAVSHAISELNSTPLPEVKWIPRNYFINEAEEIFRQREDLKGH